MLRLRITRLRLTAGILVGSLSCAGAGYAASLGLGSNSLHAWTQTLTKTTCNQTSTTDDDTYVQQALPTSTTGGTAQTLTISPVAAAQDYAFIRFNLSGCNLPTTGGADGAVLTVRVTTAGNDTISLFPVTSSWSSSTLTWNGVSGLTIGPTATGTFSASTTGNKTVTVTADVDAGIKAGNLWGWELRATSGTAIVAIGAAENSTSTNRPSMTLSDEK
ncbi:MAG TPA: DNRLRE domain-containing protein [Gaiellaceae bacterium]|nr:DNRLRE domain-containing protein [Gaiellaceae bacterium]